MIHIGRPTMKCLIKGVGAHSGKILQINHKLFLREMKGVRERYFDKSALASGIVT